jgi:hypothetical protein
VMELSDRVEILRIPGGVVALDQLENRLSVHLLPETTRSSIDAR